MSVYKIKSLINHVGNQIEKWINFNCNSCSYNNIFDCHEQSNDSTLITQ